MKTLDLSKASRPLSEYADELDDDMIVITSNQKPVAALVSLKRIDEESLRLSGNPEFMEIIESARQEFKTGRTLSLDEMKRAVS